MTVYVITKGAYSDYHICGVALDKEKAKFLKKVYSGSWEDAYIEEYDTEAVVKYEPAWKCTRDNKTGNITAEEINGVNHDEGTTGPVMRNVGHKRIYICTTDKDRAIKIASEKFAEDDVKQSLEQSTKRGKGFADCWRWLD